MRLLIAVAIVAIPVAAEAQCLGGDAHCWHQHNYNRMNDSFDRMMDQTTRNAQQQPGLLDFIIGQQRAQQEHELRMKIMREQLRQLEAQRGRQ